MPTLNEIKDDSHSPKVTFDTSTKSINPEPNLIKASVTFKLVSDDTGNYIEKVSIL